MSKQEVIIEYQALRACCSWFPAWSKTSVFTHLIPLACLTLSSNTIFGQVADNAPNNLIQDYCVDCHNLEDFSGGIAFDLMDIDHLNQEAEVWEKAIGKLRGRIMPPAGQPQPKQDEVNAFVNILNDWVDTKVH